MSFDHFLARKLPCDADWISVVDRIASVGVRRPLESIKCDAKIVLISVDLPSPVWPIVSTAIAVRCFPRTDTNDVELESAPQQLALDLRCDAVEANMRIRHDGALSLLVMILLRRLLLILLWRLLLILLWRLLLVLLWRCHCCCGHGALSAHVAIGSTI